MNNVLYYLGDRFKYDVRILIICNAIADISRRSSARLPQKHGFLRRTRIFKSKCTLLKLSFIQIYKGQIHTSNSSSNIVQPQKHRKRDVM